MIDATDTDMRGTRPFWRRKPLRAKRMLANFMLRVGPAIFEGHPGDWVCEQDGIRWIMKSADFPKFYATKPPPEEL